MLITTRDSLVNLSPMIISGGRFGLAPNFDCATIVSLRVAGNKYRPHLIWQRELHLVRIQNVDAEDLWLRRCSSFWLALPKTIPPLRTPCKSWGEDIMRVELFRRNYKGIVSAPVVQSCNNRIRSAMLTSISAAQWQLKVISPFDVLTYLLHRWPSGV